MQFEGIVLGSTFDPMGKPFLVAPVDSLNTDVRKDHR